MQIIEKVFFNEENGYFKIFDGTLKGKILRFPKWGIKCFLK